MGNIIKINIYAESREKEKNKLKLKLKSVEEIIHKYKSWLEITNREDKIETYEEFLRAQ